MMNNLYFLFDIYTYVFVIRVLLMDQNHSGRILCMLIFSYICQNWFHWFSMNAECSVWYIFYSVWFSIQLLLLEWFLVASCYMQSYAVPPSFLCVPVLCSMLSYLIGFFAITRNTMSERLFFLGRSLRKPSELLCVLLNRVHINHDESSYRRQSVNEHFRLSFFSRSVRLNFCRASLFMFFSLVAFIWWDSQCQNHIQTALFSVGLDGNEERVERRQKQKTHYFIVQCTYICSVQPTDFCGH